MNKKLLQKVEELTLYLINQQKEIEALKRWKNEITGNDECAASYKQKK